MLPGRGSAVVLRRGPGLRLDLEGDRAFVVTVDDPTTAAGLVNDLRWRSAQHLERDPLNLFDTGPVQEAL